MSSKTQKNPSIRFKGFTDAWEQRKFSDLIQTMRGGASIAPDDYKDKGIATVPKGAINSTGIADLSGSKYVSKEFFEKNKNSSVYSDELVTSLRDLVPSAPNMGRIVKLKGKDHRYLMPQGVYNLVLQDEVDENFLISFTNTSKFRKIISQEKNGSTQVHIRNSEYLGISIIIPDSEEQNKIGSFFKQLDATIALHQRQLNKYNDLKRTMLQKIFPNNHERAPQVRFDGFTGDWERRKFGDLWRKSSERNSDLKYTSLNVLSVAQMKLNPVERNSTDDYMKTYNVLYYGDIAFEGNKSKNYSFGRFVLNDVQDGIVSHVFISFRPKVEMNIDFMKIYINNENVMKHHLVKATTKTLMMTTLNVHDMNKQFLVIPNIDEQAKIGMFFKKLDDNIALHQKKINHYICLKKSFLQGMFV